MNSSIAMNSCTSVTLLAVPDFAAPTSLKNNQIHIWLMDVRETEDWQLIAADILSPAEHERAQGFKRGRETYLASRWLMRRCLGFYSGMAPEALTFARTDKGKPYLLDSDLQFNLSHSGHWVALAVARGLSLGLDLETRQRQHSLLEIAQRYYHPLEQTQLQSLPKEQQADYFYRLWTLKEAALKAIGAGISAGLDKVCFASDDIHQGALNAHICPQLSEAPWQFQQWHLPAGELIALAYDSAIPLPVIWFNAQAPAFP